MADVDDPDARLASLEHELVQLLDLLWSERGRRFVEKEHLRLGKQCLDDLEELPLREGQCSHGCGDREVEPELLEPGRSPLLHVRIARLHAPRRGQREVLGYRQIEDVRIRLIRNAEAESAGLCRGAAPAPARADLDLALTRRKEPAR